MVKMIKDASFLIAILCLASLSSAGQDQEGLLKQARQTFTPVPRLISSPTNPITPEKVKLGKTLFYETRISVDGTVSCARCHPMGLYAADGLRKSIGNNSKVNARNAPTVLNAAGQISEHWIGNRKDVEDQAEQSVTGPASFGMPSYEAVEKVLKGIKGYTALFRDAFPGDTDPITLGRFAEAIGAFERTLVTPSPFDAFLKGNQEALTASQKQGLSTFIELGCATCHSGTYVGGHMYQKFGIAEPYWKHTKSDTIDDGRYQVTRQESDKYVFKVPLLRNVKKTPPYFHDGSVSRLDDAVRVMGIVQLGKEVATPELEGIHAFLTSLTGEIPEDAMELPLLPATE
jgi:cytochrome c peroxidase